MAQPLPLETALSAHSSPVVQKLQASAQELVKNLRNTQPTGCGKHEPARRPRMASEGPHGT